MADPLRLQGLDHLADLGERVGAALLADVDGHAEPVLLLRKAGVVLEICPTSNLLTKALPSEEALRDTIRAFADRGVRFTIATDGPEIMHTHLFDELALLHRIGALGPDELAAVNATGHEAAFLLQKA